ncbi:hypothetical protein ACFZDI_26815 [Streptomyces sp. NPDC007907]|uniref:hypothetical protein n=1 Tax=Streptomyces sp. NPDC007907 TaxID=3364789 RepID=UPI0036E644B5
MRKPVGAATRRGCARTTLRIPAGAAVQLVAAVAVQDVVAPAAVQLVVSAPGESSTGVHLMFALLKATDPPSPCLERLSDQR